MSANAPTDYLPLPMVERFATDYSGKVPTSDALISPMLATPDALAAALVASAPGREGVITLGVATH